jgi:hypothetical protein
MKQILNSIKDAPNRAAVAVLVGLGVVAVPGLAGAAPNSEIVGMGTSAGTTLGDTLIAVMTAVAPLAMAVAGGYAVFRILKRVF